MPEQSLSTVEDANARASLRRLVALRWGVLGGGALVVLAAPRLFDIPLPEAAMLGVLGLLAVFNAFGALRVRREEPVAPGELLGQLGVDVAGLALLLFLSGGATNPLVSLLLMPVAVASLTLPARQAVAVASMAIAAYTLLMAYFLPLPITDAGRATSLHLAGMWGTFVVSAIMIVWFIVRMTASIRERDAQLAAAREQALRDERMLALGSLAAGAAHELGTPLATMAVIAGELEHDASLGPDARADLAVLREQVAACKGIITGLAGRAGADRLENAQSARIDAWIEGLHARWKALRPHAKSRIEHRGPSPVPAVLTEPTLEQGLLNLFNNAADASPEGIEILAEWDGDWLRIEVRDRGPGFTQELIERGGHAPLPARGSGAGIGLFLARAAIERLDGRLALSNQPGGGGLVTVALPLARLAEK